MITTTQASTFVNHQAALTNNPSRWAPSSLVIAYSIHHMMYGVSTCRVMSCRSRLIPLFQIRMLQDNATCKLLCESSVNAEDAKFVNDRIREDYALNWLVDGLPAAEMKVDTRSGDMFFDLGFNLGDNTGLNAERPLLNNHYDIVLKCGSFNTP